MNAMTIWVLQIQSYDRCEFDGISLRATEIAARQAFRDLMVSELAEYIADDEEREESEVNAELETMGDDALQALWGEHHDGCAIEYAPYRMTAQRT